MKKILQAEEAAQLAVGIFLLTVQPLHFSWWIWILLFLSPDISMLGYLVSHTIGAVTYNFFHHKLTALLVMAIGYLIHSEVAMLAGILLYSHSCFDRVLGYGLKFTDDFKHTHLGTIGHKNRNE